jgi:hypothetical protein
MSLDLYAVMLGLVPSIHAFACPVQFFATPQQHVALCALKTWMLGTSPSMTGRGKLPD